LLKERGRRMTREEKIHILKGRKEDAEEEGYVAFATALDSAINALEKEPKIKVLNRDEAIRKLGTVDIYQASAWVTLLDDLEYLGLKICEVEE
jgi:hypothetical protein